MATAKHYGIEQWKKEKYYSKNKYTLLFKNRSSCPFCRIDTTFGDEETGLLIATRLPKLTGV